MDGKNSASDQFASDDVGQPDSGPSLWRTGTVTPTYGGVASASGVTEHNIPVTHDDSGAQGTAVHVIDMSEYGECYDPNYREAQDEQPEGPEHA